MGKKYLEVGKIVGTHGIRGDVKVQPWCDSPEFLCKFKNFNFEDYIKFKVVVSKLDKVVINNLFIKYLAYLNSENDIFYLKVNDFLNNIRYYYDFF